MGYQFILIRILFLHLGFFLVRSRECPTCFVPFSHSMMILRHLTSKHNALDGIIARAHMDKMINTYRGQKVNCLFLKK